MAEFEVRCEACDVTFPVGTRSCLHCGRRLGRPRPDDPRTATLESAPSRTGVPVGDGADAEETVPRGPIRIAMALAWVLIALAGTFYRACSG